MVSHGERFWTGIHILVILTFFIAILGVIVFIFMKEIVPIILNNPRSIFKILTVFSSIVIISYLIGYLEKDFKKDYEKWKGEE